MKDYIASLVEVSPCPVQGRNVLREYLQTRILGCLQRSGAMIPLAFLEIRDEEDLLTQENLTRLLAR
jgi:hypothetical protein